MVELNDTSNVPNYPAFNTWVIPVTIDPNTIHIRGGPWSGRIYTIRDDDGDGQMERLADLIDGETATDEILSEFRNPGQVVRILEELSRTSVLVDAEHQDVTFDHRAMKTRFTGFDSERLESNHVGIITAGSMGEMVATDLCRMGVTDVMVRDAPRFEGDAGALPDAVTRTDADVEHLVEAADFIVVTATEPRPELLGTVNEVAHETGTPWVSAQLDGLDGRVGPAVFPGDTACYDCFTERRRSNQNNPDGYEAYQAAVSEGPTLERRTLPGFGRAIAGLLAMDLVHLLTYGVGYTAGRVVTISSLDLSIDADEVLKVPRCRVCGADIGTDDARFTSFRDQVVDDLVFDSRGGE